MLHTDHRRQLEVDLDTLECSLPDDELAHIQEPLDQVAEAVEEMPASLKMVIVHHPRSDQFHVDAELRLPRRTLFTSDWDPYLDTAVQRSIRKLLRKIEAYKAEPDRQADEVKERVDAMHRDVVAPVGPDMGPLAEAAEDGDYHRFRELLAGHDDWLRLRIGRWLQRYPALNDEVGSRLAIGDLVEEVFLNAFERYCERPGNTTLSDWLEDLIDPSLKALWRNRIEERENVSQARTLRQTRLP